MLKHQRSISFKVILQTHTHLPNQLLYVDHQCGRQLNLFCWQTCVMLHRCSKSPTT